MAKAPIGVAKAYFPSFLRQRNLAIRMDSWINSTLDDRDKPHLPKTATAEHKALRDISSTPWLATTMGSVAQGLFVEGHREPRANENSQLWTTLWQPNGLDSRQIAVHRAALSHGVAYVTVLPGENQLTREAVAEIRGVSAKRMIAFYQDEARDEYPVYAIQAEKSVTRNDDGTLDQKWLVQLWDDQDIYFFGCDLNGTDGWHYIETRHHGVGVCPVIRFANTMDLDGLAIGEIEPFIPLAKRIDQDTFDRLIVQRYGAFKVRWVAGLEEPDTDTAKRAAAIGLTVGDLVVMPDPTSKAGTFDATPLDGYIRSRDADIRDLAAVTQTPPHHLLGLSPNLSAEALAAAEASLMRKVEERRHLFGESWEGVMRLGAWVSGDRAAASSFTNEVKWRDIESRSLAQVADALGKLAAQLGVPFEMLWERIPGWTDNDTKIAKELRKQQEADAILAAELLGQVNPGGAASGQQQGGAA